MTTIIHEFAEHVRGYMSSGVGIIPQLSNCCMGLSGEVGELIDAFTDKERTNRYNDVMEEMGDVFFYLYGICDQLKIDASRIHDMVSKENVFKHYSGSVKDSLIHNECLNLAVWSGAISNRVKKHIHRGYGINMDLLERDLGEVYCILCDLCHLFDIDYADVMRANIEKLQKQEQQ